MRFEVKYPSGEPHEVELSGTVAVLGRDPSCDLVLNDARCSRRHAVVEAGPQGISIRDAGSANGIYVNGKKVERSALADGDVVRLGEVSLRVLPEEVPGTVVMAPEDLESMEVMHQSIDTARTASVPPKPSAEVG
ncbi:MAG TPA: FHA domain-containing protein, partial [Vicinamibacteria bacterium]|nr:FHA domain-containing protein [Vicinamibacteria bacterium]